MWVTSGWWQESKFHGLYHKLVHHFNRRKSLLPAPFPTAVSSQTLRFCGHMKDKGTNLQMQVQSRGIKMTAFQCSGGGHWHTACTMSSVWTLTDETRQWNSLNMCWDLKFCIWPNVLHCLAQSQRDQGRPDMWISTLVKGSLRKKKKQNSGESYVDLIVSKC